jgi:hypothetical protein
MYTTIEDSTSLNLTKHFEQPTSSLTVEISKTINEAIVVLSCEPVECLSDVTVLKDEQKFNQDILLFDVFEYVLSKSFNLEEVT